MKFRHIIPGIPKKGLFQFEVDKYVFRTNNHNKNFRSTQTCPLSGVLGPLAPTHVEEESKEEQRERVSTQKSVRDHHRLGELVLFTSVLHHFHPGVMRTVPGVMIPF